MSKRASSAFAQRLKNRDARMLVKEDWITMSEKGKD
jgi:hypothetical protein